MPLAAKREAFIFCGTLMELFDATLIEGLAVFGSVLQMLFIGFGEVVCA